LQERELAVAARSPAAPSPRAPSRQADPAALARALREGYPGLASLLVRRVGDPQLAQDLLQDAILTTLARLEGGAAVPPDVLAGYVFRTALNHLRNHRRHARLHAEDGAAIEALVDPDAGPLEQTQRASLRELVRRVLQDLSSSRDRELLVRYYLDEEDKLQLCESMALTGPQFDRVIFRARDRLKALIGRAGLQRWDLFVLTLLLFKGVAEVA
jgi:RNA polymerase sigma-70 factor (ECF subfamily)